MRFLASSWQVWGVALVLAWIMLPGVEPTWGQASEALAIEGKVSQINKLGILTIAIDAPGGDPDLRDCLVVGTTKVTLDGAAAGLSDLGPGMVVKAICHDDLPASEVMAYTHVDNGSVQSMAGAVDSVSRGEIAILLDNRNRHTSTVSIDAGTKLTLDGKPVGVDEVKQRMYAEVTYVNGAATQIAVRTWINDAKPHNVVGIVREVDLAHLVVSVGRADQTYRVTLPCGSKLAVFRGADRTDLNDVTVGARVQATYQNGEFITINLVVPQKTLP